MIGKVIQTKTLMMLLLLLALATAVNGLECTGRDGRKYPIGHMLPHPQDGCQSKVCRCKSENLCQMVDERRTLHVQVLETVVDRGSLTPTQTTTRMQCTCIDQMVGSPEMNFTCQPVKDPNRNLGLNFIGCLDFRNISRPPGDPVIILNSRNESMKCRCNNLGQYVNCFPTSENPNTSDCVDENNRPVKLGSSYIRNEVNSRGLTVRLRCVCVQANLATVCSLVP